MLNVQSKTQSAAEAECQKLGAKLVSIHGKDEETYVRDAGRYVGTAWTGFIYMHILLLVTFRTVRTFNDYDVTNHTQLHFDMLTSFLCLLSSLLDDMQ